MLNLANRIRQARKSRALTQAALAAELGVNRSAVAQWEGSQGSRPTSRNLERIAIACAVSFDWLATGRGRMHVQPSGQPHDSVFLIRFHAENELEERLLNVFRRMNHRQQKPLVDILELTTPSRTR